LFIVFASKCFNSKVENKFLSGYNGRTLRPNMLSE
jgi:hypothetical protein